MQKVCDECGGCDAGGCAPAADAHPSSRHLPEPMPDPRAAAMGGCLALRDHLRNSDFRIWGSKGRAKMGSEKSCLSRAIDHRLFIGLGLWAGVV